MNLHSHDLFAMGTPCAVHLYADSADRAAIGADAAAAEVLRLEHKYSRYRPDSFLAEINDAAMAGRDVRIDRETATLLDHAFGCHVLSQGRFDITSGILREAWDFSDDVLPTPERVERLLPRIGMDKLTWRSPWLSFDRAGMELDLGGVVKEYAADRAAEACRREGLDHGLVDLGGDIRIVGPQPDGQPWRIGIRHPVEPETPMAIMELGCGGVASSGGYERFIEVDGVRYGHILDPRTGWPVRGLSAVSVAAESCLAAGSASTIAMLMQTQGPDWLCSLGLRHVWMDDEGRQGGRL